MGKNLPKGVEGYPAGSRTSRDHHPNGWVEGGREDEEIKSVPFDPNLAALHAAQHQARQQKG